jgi:hypothetical protein
MADVADRLADESERTADVLDAAAVRSDPERRRALAAWERNVAGAQRRNAEELRQSDHDPHLEPLPHDPPG